MTRSIERLPPRAVETIKKPGRHSDGGNLYLSISPDGTRKRWVFLYTFRGKQREAGLGPAGPRGVSLKAARAEAREYRERLASGLDPLDDRKLDVKVPTFAEAAADYFATHESGWSSARHRQQFANTLRDYSGPIANKPVDQIDTELVLAVLKPIWTRIPETAARVRGRIESVLDAARARGFIDANKANPARLKGHLDHLLPRRKAGNGAHHKALAYEAVPGFLAQLKSLPDSAARALEFTILTAVRTGEALGARFEEFDLEARVWTIPAERTKTRTEHRVPLSDRAVAIVLERREASPRASYVFGGLRPGSRLADTAMRKLMRGLKAPGTVHGFRSAFRDWCGDETAFPREIAEAALGHRVGGAVERAYRRGDALAKRRELMVAWERYVTGTEGSNVID